MEKNNMFQTTKPLMVVPKCWLHPDDDTLQHAAKFRLLESRTKGTSTQTEQDLLLEGDGRGWSLMSSAHFKSLLGAWAQDAQTRRVLFPARNLPHLL